MALVLGMSFASQAKAQNRLETEATASIENYFHSSQRKVESIDLGDVSWLMGDEYLMQADVVAQAPFKPHYISYHCGVFLLRKQVNGVMAWIITTVTCEPIE